MAEKSAIYLLGNTLFKKMVSCSAEVVDGVLTLTPTRHYKLEAWQGLDKAENIVILFDSPASEIGAALRMALAKCIP